MSTAQTLHKPTWNSEKYSRSPLKFGQFLVCSNSMPLSRRSTGLTLLAWLTAVVTLLMLLVQAPALCGTCRGSHTLAASAAASGCASACHPPQAACHSTFNASSIAPDGVRQAWALHETACLLCAAAHGCH